MSLVVSPLSLVYVKQQVSAVKSGAVYDPTGDTVQLAFLPFGQQPASGDWKAASWETISSKYYARCLVGPGGAITLTNGRYQIWVKITDNPEIPVLRGDEITVADD